MTNITLDEFLDPYSPTVRELALQARAIIREVMPDTLEQLDPSARLIAYGLDASYKGLICGIMLNKASINLMFAQGASLPDPAGLLTGTGKRARHVRIDSDADLAVPALRSLLESALQRMKK